MMNTLHTYIQNYRDPEANFALGREYELMGQTGAAISFYLRTAERSQTDVQQYEALLRCALCFERQKTRDNTEKILLLKAISLLPVRPEAHFLLSRLHEFQSEWQDSYTVACIALTICDFTLSPLTTDVEYPGMYGLIFQKGVAAWWVGHCDESRELMADLKFDHIMNTLFSSAVDNNLASIGYPNTISPYYKDMMPTIRYQFDNIELIDKNYSQSYQDMFVLSATNGKKNGLYLEIGSAEPFKNNNTALLETKFGWKGISLDINEKVVEEFREERSNPVFCMDATQLDYAKFLKNLGYYSQDFDYLQVDCDPPSNSFLILKKMPFDEYRFATITFEHDFYADSNIKEESRRFLKSKGYELLVSDIAYNKVNSYEDWWVHPELVDQITKTKLKDISGRVKYAKDYFFKK